MQTYPSNYKTNNSTTQRCKPFTVLISCAIITCNFVREFGWLSSRGLPRIKPPGQIHQSSIHPSSTSHDTFHNELPYIGRDKFDEKYASMFNGLLPSSKREHPDTSCGTASDFIDFFQLPKSERSRFNEDWIIYELFKNTTSNSFNTRNPLTGTYVELGAFDGKEESNTIFFDKCLGWDGLLIEGQAQSYQKVIVNRPHAVKMSFSPTCQNENETASFYDYPLSNNGMKGLAKSYLGKETIEIPCGSLTPVLLDIFGPNASITFFSLDVEGAELAVLQTIDFDAVNIEVIMVEVQNTHCPNANCENVHNIRKHMATTQKYSLFAKFVRASDVYIRWGTPAWIRAKEIEMNRKGG